ncbi:hypothetical protein CDAR_496491 [Caerostris darwini]|uniref:Uncharacterized protein n=1 Tax=Caerostris darwini TaxID=1538125 RepID=A0AAV4Q6U2_9ARAC|nr:hypothetical protein CDAR_496491 [Caerostris darwini]
MARNTFVLRSQKVVASREHKLKEKQSKNPVRVEIYHFRGSAYPIRRDSFYCSFFLAFPAWGVWNMTGKELDHNILQQSSGDAVIRGAGGAYGWNKGDLVGAVTPDKV